MYPNEILKFTNNVVSNICTHFDECIDGCPFYNEAFSGYCTKGIIVDAIAEEVEKWIQKIFLWKNLERKRDDGRLKFSYSRVDTFNQCPLKFKYRYIDGLELISVPDFNSPLVLGSAIHKGIESGVDAMEREYKENYPVLETRHYNELLKLDYNLNRINKMIPTGGQNEVKLETNDFIGFVDYLVPNENGNYDIYDWKYTNNIDNYNNSGQLHIYKYMTEELLNIKVDNIYYLFIPKSFVRQKKTETIAEFRRRMIEDLANKDPTIKKVEYDVKKVLQFFTDCNIIVEGREYPKRKNQYCKFCEYRKICEGKEDLMILPKNEKVKRENGKRKKIWIYGKPFSGKTYLANSFPDVLMLNTDGNYTRVDAPVISIKDEVSTEGRLVKRKYAWQVFSEVIEELEKGSEFKTVVVDLLEDVYDACRVYVCHENGWTHESDDSFRSYDMIRSEFLRTIKRLTNLDLNVILLSHEDSSRDITKKGSQATLIKPAIQDKLALKISGMMDLVCRLENEEDNRQLTLKQNENIFGGGRIKTQTPTINATLESIDELYK